MLDQPALCRLVVVWRHDERAIGADFLGELNKADRLSRVVRPGARNHGNAASGGFHNRCDHLFMFFMAQRRAFTGGANGDETVRPFGDVPFNQIGEGLVIHPSVLKRGNQGGH